MQCAPKPVCPSQDQPVRTAASQWRTCVQDYPWASAWPISLNHAQASALQPMETHTARSLLGNQDRNAVSREQQQKQETFPMFHQLAICSSLRPRPCDLFIVQPGKGTGLQGERVLDLNHMTIKRENLAGHNRTRRDTIKHSGQFSKATHRPLKDCQPFKKKKSFFYTQKWMVADANSTQ